MALSSKKLRLPNLVLPRRPAAKAVKPTPASAILCRKSRFEMRFAAKSRAVSAINVLLSYSKKLISSFLVEPVP
jgi:hypothetical protein